MNIRALLQKANIIGRINNLEKASSVKQLDTRPYGGLTTFESRQKFPIPYYDHLRYLAKRNTSLRTIHHVLQDKILERDPEFIPRFGSKCMECGKEFKNQTDICDCGGMTREPDQAQLTLIKEFFKDCNDNDQSFKAVLRECEDNLNTLDDAFLVIIKKYYFNSDNELTFSQVREILSLDPEWMNFDLDDKMRQGTSHWTCVEHRTLHDEEGVCPECGKPLFPVWYIYDEGSQPMPYLKDEIIHWSRYSPSKTHGYPPVATVFEEAMIELNGNILLNDTYREQRPPKGILAIVTKNLASLQKFWEKEMDRVRVNPNHMPVMGIESDTGRGSAQYTALLNSVADMDVLNVSERMRESISGLYRISPMYRGSTEGVGGLNAEDIQRAVTAEPVAAAHQGYHEEVFPKLLAMFGITDWKLEFPSPYPANDDAELDKRMKETQIATMMHGMGFSIDLDDETGEFVYSGSAQPAQPDMGMGGGEDGEDFDGGGGYQDELLLGKELQKARRYIKNPRDAPPGAKVQRGKRGGYFYESTVPNGEKTPAPKKAAPKKHVKSLAVKQAKKEMNAHIGKLHKTIEGKALLDRVESYTGGDYKSFNEYLRTGKMALRDLHGKVRVVKPPKAKKEQLDRQINQVSEFLKTAPKIEGTMYRGMIWKKDKKQTKAFKEFMAQMKPGAEITFPTFTSTSTDEATALEFATLASKKEPVHSVVITMEQTKSGVYLDGASAFEVEDEVLFDRQSKFEVVGVDYSEVPIRLTIREV